MKHALVAWWQLRAQQRQLGVRRVCCTDEDTFGFPDFSYVNPVIPDRSLWMHDPSSVAFTASASPACSASTSSSLLSRLVVTLAGRYDSLALDATRGTSARVEQTFDAFSPKVGATVRLLESDRTGDWNRAERVRRVLAGVSAASPAERAASRRYRAQPPARGYRELRGRSEGQRCSVDDSRSRRRIST